MSRSARAAAVMMWLWTVACSPPDETVDGVAIWTVDPTPLTEVFQRFDDPDAVLQYARDATRLASGTLVVADQYAGSVHFFGPDGRWIRSVGQRGRGPGELGDPWKVDLCGPDELFLWDYTRRSIFVMDTLGTVLRQYRPEGAPHEIRCSGSGWWGVLDIPTNLPPPGSDSRDAASAIWIADDSGRVVRELGSVPFGQNRPLRPLTSVAVGREVFYVGTADSAWVDVYGPSGERLEGVRLGMSGRNATADDYAGAIDAMISVVRFPEIREQGRALYAAVPMPDHTPPYRALLVDPDDRLWAVVSPRGALETELQGIEPVSGSRVELRIPEPVDVVEIGRDYVLVIAEDDLGQQRILVYGIARGD